MSLEEQLAQADELHVKEDINGMFALLEKLDKENSSNVEVMWRLARCHYLLAKEAISDAGKRETHMRTALSLIEKAYAAQKDSFSVNKWFGILLGSMGEFISTKEKIGNAWKIKEFFDKALEIKPDDATTWHALGVWSWNVYNIGFMERGIASALFATPPSATVDDCEKCFMKSFELNSGDVANCLKLGDVYYAKKDWKEAKRFYTLASECEAKTANAKAMVEEAKTKIGKC